MSGLHTAGPWEVVNLSGVGGPHSIRMTYSGDKTFYGVRQIHRKEDAHAIAALPDVLAALEAILDEQDANEGHASIEAYDAGRAAIAKAKGGAL